MFLFYANKQLDNFSSFCVAFIGRAQQLLFVEY